jgi:hypothetical protein
MLPPPWLRILVFQSLRGVWVARALEHDVAAEARSCEAAVSAVLQILFAHIDLDRRHGRPPLSAFPAAPERYRSAFARATPLRLMGTAPRNGVSEDLHIAVALSHDVPSARAIPMTPMTPKISYPARLAVGH